jgi:hypothetical protein
MASAPICVQATYDSRNVGVGMDSGDLPPYFCSEDAGTSTYGTDVVAHLIILDN